MIRKKYIAVNVIDGTFYKQGRCGRWTTDINQARVYSRRSDLTNSIRPKGCCNIIELDLDPAIHYRVYCESTGGDCFDFKARDFNTLEEAQKYHQENLGPNLTAIAYLPGRLSSPPLSKTRPSWENYFFGLAVTASKRSHDVHTKVGAVIADKDHHIVGIGYNGFPRGMVDSSLPLERPQKYQWMVHAEMNAVTNCLHKPEGCTIYLTLAPCGECAIHMWQNGIQEIVYDNTTDCTKKDWFKPDVLRKLQQDTDMVIRGVTPDLGWM